LSTINTRLAASNSPVGKPSIVTVEFGSLGPKIDGAYDGDTNDIFCARILAVVAQQ
jgi:hypothetical protein